MNLHIFFLLVFSSQIIQFERHNASVNWLLRMNPIKCQSQLIRVVSAPSAKFGLASSAQGVLEPLVCITGAEVVGRVVIRHMFSANVQDEESAPSTNAGNTKDNQNEK